MTIKKIDGDFSVCKVEDYSCTNLNADFVFVGKTNEENSLVCLTKDVPCNTTEREDGWKAICIQGILDFSLIGILAKIATVLSDHGISIFAISTYNTDYILLKEENFQKALGILTVSGYDIV